jgi:hypothetical protein
MRYKNTSKNTFISDSGTSIKESDSYFLSDDCLLIVNRKTYKNDINSFLSKSKKNRNKIGRGILVPLDNFTY